MEWLAPASRTERHAFRLSHGDDLPAKVDPDDELAIYFDCDLAVSAILHDNSTTVEVIDAHGKGWDCEISDEIRDLAHQHLEDSEQSPSDHHAADGN